jgi:hypothetical protein
MANRSAWLFVCIAGFLLVFGSLEYMGLIEYAPHATLGLYTLGVLCLVFGAKGVIRK